MLRPAGYDQKAVFVVVAQISGPKPTVPKRLGGRFGVLEVSLHHIVAANDDLAPLPYLRLGLVIDHDPALDVVQNHSAASELVASRELEQMIGAASVSP